MSVVRLLHACWNEVSHRQFSGEYGPSLSMRPRDVFGSHVDIIASRNFKRPCCPTHSSQTAMPLPPYAGYAGSLVLKHLASMLRYEFSMGCGRPPMVRPWVIDAVLAMAWPFSVLARLVSARRHPQDRVAPRISALDVVEILPPHSHTQRHFIRCDWFWRSETSTTSKRPNFIPAMFLKGGICAP